MLDAQVCPKCDTEFTPKRSNQTYCEPSCQKTATRNAARGSRAREYEERNIRHFERSHRLFEMLYTTPPNERLGMMKHILSFIPVDKALRDILTDPKLLREPPRVDGRKNIAQAANAYVKMFFRVSISTYVRKTRRGAELEGVEVVIPQRSGPPVLNLSRALERRNRPLVAGPLDVVGTLRDAAQASREANPELADKLRLMADLRQAATVTEADHERVDAIVTSLAHVA